MGGSTRTLLGTGLGAVAGSIFPVVGTGLGAALGGGLGSALSDSKDYTPGATPQEKALSQIALANWNQTDPLRQTMLGGLQKTMAGQTPIYSLPQYAPMRAATEAQYRTARNNTIGSVPEGGALARALANLESNRAQTLSAMGGDLLQDAINKSYGVAFQAPQTSLSGLSSSGAMAAQRQQAGLAAETGKGQGIGQLIGQIGAASLLRPS